MLTYHALDELLTKASPASGPGCWEWQYSVDGSGYGKTRHAGRIVSAHRLAYELTKGPIPDGLTVDHECYNPRCINPSHLRLLTLEENLKHSRSALKTHCVNGHEYTPENTRYRGPNELGARDCRKCNQLAVARYQARKRSRGGDPRG